MKKVGKTNKWVPLKFDDIPEGDFEGLIGIEELKDYTVINDKKRKKNARKRENPSSDEEDVPAVKKKKKKVANKSKQSKPVESESEIELEVPEFTINRDIWSSLGVPEVIIKSLRDQEFQTPTLIQSLTLAPAILGRRDILGVAETGSGKTLTFGIPIINGILELKKKEAEKSSDSENSDSDEDSDEEIVNNKKLGCVKVVHLDSDKKIAAQKKPLYALILTPTRELAIQIKNHLKNAAKYTDLQIAVVVGGMAAVKQERILNKGPEIVIATPGRLWELISEKNKHLSQISSLKFLAIDETDRMLETGHFEELYNIIELMNANEEKVKERQNFVFSATLSFVHDIPNYVIRKKSRNPHGKIEKQTSDKKLKNIIELLKMKNPKVIDITKDKKTAESLTECRITCTMDHKDYYLYYFLKRHPGRTLIFCNSIGCVKRLSTIFGILECKPLPLHASMIQRQRLKNLERFQANSDGLLIATDVAARGLDIPNIDHVIHYQVPRTSESYIHRSGRTARVHKEGITILIMDPSEMQFYIRLCKNLGRSSDIPIFPVNDHLLISVKERVDIARQIDQLELKSKRDNVQKDWVKKAIEDMDILLDNDQKECTMDDKQSADLRKSLKIKRGQLRSLISNPLFPKGFSGKYPEVNLELSLEQNSEKAIDVMKKSIQEKPLRRKRDKLTVDAIKKSKRSLKRKAKNEKRKVKKNANKS